jgi:hypothetical protein
LLTLLATAGLLVALALLLIRLLALLTLALLLLLLALLAALLLLTALLVLLTLILLLALVLLALALLILPFLIRHSAHSIYSPREYSHLEGTAETRPEFHCIREKTRLAAQVSMNQGAKTRS